MLTRSSWPRAAAAAWAARTSSMPTSTGARCCAGPSRAWPRHPTFERRHRRDRARSASSDAPRCYRGWLDGSGCEGASWAASVGSSRWPLACARPAAEVVLVHDAARPFVSIGAHPHAWSMPSNATAQPSRCCPSWMRSNTSEDGRITKPAEREGLYRAQTPQGARRELLVGGCRRHHADGADTDPG